MQVTAQLVTYKGLPVKYSITKAARWSTTHYSIGNYSDPSYESLGTVENYHGSPLKKGWVALDANGSLIDGPFETKKEAEAIFFLDLATRP